MNLYPAVIEALMNGELNYRSVVIEIAKKHPKIVLAAIKDLSQLPWMKDIDELLRQDRKIDAIKLWRSEEGIGLKEAKDAVEARQEKLGLV